MDYYHEDEALKGKKIVIAFITTLIIYRIVNFYFVVKGGENLLTQIGSLFLLALFSMFLYRGYNWAGLIMLFSVIPDLIGLLFYLFKLTGLSNAWGGALFLVVLVLGIVLLSSRVVSMYESLRAYSKLKRSK